MKFARYLTPLLATTLIAPVPGILHAAETRADPEVTRKTLAMLMAASNEPVPASSSCQGDYGQVGTVKVKDVLAMEFAFLYNGKNVVKAHCSSKTCTLIIRHAAGESLSSADIRFNVAAGKAVVSSLECFMTP